jgi:D-alanyl-D-alanine carboxypeptidase/D-alanyl-D-alanine-endopeptidase (penicillin-binding protein 4)
VQQADAPAQPSGPEADKAVDRTPPPERAPDVDLPSPPAVTAPVPPPRPPRRGPISRRTAALSVVLVAAVLAAGSGVAALSDDPGDPASAPSPASSAHAVAPAVPGATPPPPAADVLPGLAAAAPLPTAAGLRRVLGPLLRTPGLGSSVSAEVVDLTTGASLLAVSPTRPAVPASSAKLLTGAAALSLLGPGTRLATTVVAGPTGDEVVLVGGGDVTLAAGSGTSGAAFGRAGMADLAEAAAAALKAQGRTSVAVRLDDSLFTGAAVSNRWSAGDVRGGFVAPVMAVAVNSGSATPGTPLVPGEPARRVADPAMAAARQFASRLRAQGITVTGAVARAAAPAGGTLLAKVESATVADLVERALTDSDNTVAEALARMVAVKAGRQATFADAGVAVLDRVDLLGVPVEGAQLTGGSGLGGGNRVPARTLARLLVLAASAEHPELRPLLSGLPVAGASGTLTDRFAGARDKAGLGVVRAKTGTLTGASSLAGTVVDADGRMLGFVIEADAVSSTVAARAALDAAASALAGCGCR